MTSVWHAEFVRSNAIWDAFIRNKVATIRPGVVNQSYQRSSTSKHSSETLVSEDPTEEPQTPPQVNTNTVGLIGEKCLEDFGKKIWSKGNIRTI
jgi:hypothetical protein